MAGRQANGETSRQIPAALVECVKHRFDDGMAEACHGTVGDDLGGRVRKRLDRTFRLTDLIVPVRVVEIACS